MVGRGLTPNFSAEPVDETKDASILMCIVCRDPFAHPVMCEPCEHIFCRNCIVDLKQCPSCRVPIERFARPPRTIVDMTSKLVVRCEDCDGVMGRQESLTHHCNPRPKRHNAPLVHQWPFRL